MEEKSVVILAAIRRIGIVSPAMPFFLAANREKSYRSKRSGAPGGGQVCTHGGRIFAMAVLGVNRNGMGTLFHIDKIRRGIHGEVFRLQTGGFFCWLGGCRCSLGSGLGSSLGTVLG